MASPQRERGHIDIANEIADKLCATRISGREWQIIWVVLRKTWGWLENPKTDKKTKKKMDAISKSQFAELTGIPRQKCQELLNGLVLKKILIKGVTQKGNTIIATYGFQKDYSKWKLLPKKVTVTQKGNGVLPKKVMGVLPKKVNTKDSLTKETIQKKENLTTAFPKNAVSGEPFYLTKKKKKLTGWKLETFEQFWQVFDWKKGKAEASDAWLQIPGLTKESATEKIIPAAEHESNARLALVSKGKTPKWAQGWLSGRRWEDEQIKPKYLTSLQAWLLTDQYFNKMIKKPSDPIIIKVIDTLWGHGETIDRNQKPFMQRDFERVYNQFLSEINNGDG